MRSNNDSAPKSVLHPVVLPSGLVMPNGLVKVALYEHMTPLFGGLPNSDHLALYNLWSQGGWGMIMTGNVQVSREHLTLGKDMIIPEVISSDTVRAYRALARAMRPASEQNLPKDQDASTSTATPRTLIIMQVSHAGRQSPVGMGGRPRFEPPFAPSAVALRHGAPSGWFGRLLFRLMFPTPRAMNSRDIDHVVNRFVATAKLAHDAGFDGMEVHASHGYLLAQFISPKSNVRDDAYGASHAPLYLLERIVTSIREVLPRPFVLGVKLNSSDYVSSGSTPDPRAEEEAEERVIAHLVQVARWDMLDFIEISGGDYENPSFLNTGRRQAFYGRFARKARSAIHAQASSSRHPLVILTGGMRTPATMQDALAQGHADLIGIGRGSVLAPKLPLLLKEHYDSRRQQTTTPKDGGNEYNVDVDREFPVQQEPTLSYPETPLVRLATSVLRSLGLLPLPTLIGAGFVTAWYVEGMRRLSKGQTMDYRIGALRATLLLWLPELRALTVPFVFCVALLSILPSVILFRK